MALSTVSIVSKHLYGLYLSRMKLLTLDVLPGAHPGRSRPRASCRSTTLGQSQPRVCSWTPGLPCLESLSRGLPCPRASFLVKEGLYVILSFSAFLSFL